MNFHKINPTLTKKFTDSVYLINGGDHIIMYIRRHTTEPSINYSVKTCRSFVNDLKEYMYHILKKE
jgi:hypothetical protein